MPSGNWTPSIPGFTPSIYYGFGAGSGATAVRSFDRGAYQRGASQILAGYGDIAERVTSGLRGSNQAELLDIYDQYVKAGAQQKQQAITAGLRNTTKSRLTTPSTLLGQKWRAEAASNSALARAIADYEARIGLQGLGAAGTFFGQENQLALNYDQLAQQAQLTREGLANQRSLAAGRGGGGGGGGGDPFASLDRNRAIQQRQQEANMRAGLESDRLQIQAQLTREGYALQRELAAMRRQSGGGGGGGGGGNPFYAGDYGGNWFGPGDYPGGGGGNFYDPFPGGGSGGYPGPDSYYYPVPVAQGPYGEPEPTEGPPPDQGQGPGGPSDFQYYLGNQWVWDSEVPYGYDNGSGGGDF